MYTIAGTGWYGVRVVDDGILRLEWAGALADFSTDETELVATVIEVAHNYNFDVSIPHGVVWDYNSLNQSYTATVATADTTTADGFSGLPTSPDLAGCFVWNTTDFSYGVVSSNTATSITVSALYLGTDNDFDVSDNVIVSRHRVNVNIFDYSKYDSRNNVFTGQWKEYVNSDVPHTKSANEKWIVDQYHPGILACNRNPSDMEGRASFLARKYNASDKIQGFVQFGLNPINNTDSTANPGAASDVLIAMGHNQGVAGNDASSLIALGLRASDAMDGLFAAVGTRAQDGISWYQKQDRNVENVHVYDAEGTQRTTWRFYNAGVDGGRYIRHWNAFSGGFTGYCSLVVPQTSSTTIDETLYCGATLTNEGAAGVVTISFATTCPIGYEQELVVDTAQNFVIQVLGGQQLYNGDTTRRSNTVGDVIKIKKITSTDWAIIQEKGTWST
jgi:hypothetical protein